MPPRLTAHDFDQEVLVLFDAYVHGRIDRRGFLVKAEKFATAGVTAAGLLAALSSDFAAGEQVRKDDPRLRTENVNIPSPQGNGTIKAYFVGPSSAGTTKLPDVLVMHENRGSIRTSRTSRGASRSTASWRRTRRAHAAGRLSGRPAMRSRNSTRARRCRTSSPQHVR